MTAPLPLPTTALGLMMIMLGFALGLAYFAALRKSAALYVAGRGWFGPLALTLIRLSAIVACLMAVAKLGGALLLLASFAGFLIARATALRITLKVA